MVRWGVSTTNAHQCKRPAKQLSRAAIPVLITYRCAPIRHRFRSFTAFWQYIMLHLSSVSWHCYLAADQTKPNMQSVSRQRHNSQWKKVHTYTDNRKLFNLKINPQIRPLRVAAVHQLPPSVFRTYNNYIAGLFQICFIFEHIKGGALEQLTKLRGAS